MGKKVNSEFLNIINYKPLQLYNFETLKLKKTKNDKNIPQSPLF
jgi:hypothetical protein